MKKTIRMKSFFFTGMLVLLIIISSSCTEGFIDVESNKETENDITSEQAVELVNATYNIFLKWGMSSFSWIGVSSITSDDADKGSDLGDTGVDKDLMDNLTYDATSISIAEVWESHYDGIQRANQALDRLELFDNLGEEIKGRLIGEVKFLRALMYFRLVKTFGGVPLLSGVPDLKDSGFQDVLKRATREESYNFIKSDLVEAISLLPEKNNYPLSEIGRATKGAAKTLLAKVYMYQNNWEEVLNLTNEVIASGQYALTPNYEDIWKETGENNEESIFEIQAKGEIPTAGVEGYSATQGARGEGGWGWGFNTPTEELANSYEENDLRRDATIIFRGEVLYDGREVPNTVVNAMYNQKAYSSAFTDAWQTGKNVRILRYAEVLLMNAEAAFSTGADAATPLNQVRNRAGLDNVTTINEFVIWQERRHELAFEHDRFFDLVRQGRAGHVLRNLGKPFVDGKHELFPIPQEQINKSEGVLIQNPGW